MTQLLTLIQNNQRSTNKQNTQDVMMLTQLLNQMDGLNHVKILLQQQIDRRLDPHLRPGRFDKVPTILPAKRKRFELFKFYRNQVLLSLCNWDYLLNKQLV
jgi:ATP-dependent 26S proteasome regulatory subunit